MKKPLQFDFNRALNRGHVSYNASIGKWWENQAADSSHQRAYRFVAEYIRDRMKRKSSGTTGPLIVDYACGGGYVLMQLAKMMPTARIVGLDGSHKMLALAQQRLEQSGVSCAILPTDQAFASNGPRVRLVETRLPNFKLPKGKADAVAFVFPNIAPGPKDQPVYDRHGYKHRADTIVAKMLARFREMDPEDEVVKDDPDTLFDGYMSERVLARNIHGLLKPGGMWFKVDYANALRSELSELSQWRCLFSECALEAPIKEKNSELLFKLRDNVFRTSKVIFDVYHQTKDPSDKEGGYFITLFEGV